MPIFIFENHEIWTAKSLIAIEADTLEEAYALDAEGKEIGHTEPEYLETDYYSGVIDTQDNWEDTYNIYTQFKPTENEKN